MEFSEFIYLFIFFTCVLPVELYTSLSCVLGLSKMSVKLLDNIQVMSCQYFFHYFMDFFFFFFFFFYSVAVIICRWQNMLVFNTFFIFKIKLNSNLLMISNKVWI